MSAICFSFCETTGFRSLAQNPGLGYRSPPLVYAGGKRKSMRIRSTVWRGQCNGGLELGLNRTSVTVVSVVRFVRLLVNNKQLIYGF